MEAQPNKHKPINNNFFFIIDDIIFMMDLNDFQFAKVRFFFHINVGLSNY
jgi:hypothetical protein